MNDNYFVYRRGFKNEFPTRNIDTPFSKRYKPTENAMSIGELSCFVPRVTCLLPFDIFVGNSVLFVI